MIFDKAWRVARDQRWIAKWEVVRARGRRRFLVRGSLQQAAIFAPMMVALQAWFIASEGRPIPSVARAAFLIVIDVTIGLVLGFVSLRAQWRLLDAVWEGRSRGETPDQLRVRLGVATGRPLMIFSTVAFLGMGILAAVVAVQTGSLWMWIWCAVCFTGMVYFIRQIGRLPAPDTA